MKTRREKALFQLGFIGSSGGGGTPDALTAATIENADTDAMVLVFNTAQTIDYTAWSLTSDNLAITITGILSGNGTDTITVSLSRAVVYAETITVDGELSTNDFAATNNVAADSDFQAIVTAAQAAGDTIPTAHSRMLLNLHMIEVKASGKMAKALAYYQMISFDPGERNRNWAKYNWKNPAQFKLVESGDSLSYDGNTGWWAYGTNEDGYLSTGIVLSTDGGSVFQQNSCAFEIYSGKASLGNYNFSAFNTGGTTGTSFSDRAVNNTTVASRLNTATTQTPAITSHGEYFWYVERTVSTQYLIYQNNTLFSTQVVTSSALTDQEIVFLKTNIGGTITGNEKNIATFWIGSPLTSGERGSSYTEHVAFKAKINNWRNHGLTDEKLVSDFASHCYFVRNSALYSATYGKTWITSVWNATTGGYRQSIFEINNTTGAVVRVNLGSVYQFDDHNEPSIILRASDGRLLAMYSEHSGQILRWKVSVNPGDASSWGSEITLNRSSFNPDGLISYATVKQASNGNIFVFFRDIDPVNGTGWSYLKSTNNGATFGSYTVLTQDINSPQPTYCIVKQNGDILHFICSDNAQEAGDQTLAHFYLDLSDETIYDSAGNALTAPLTFSEMTTIITVDGDSPNYNALWVDDITVDGSGNPRCVFAYYPAAQDPTVFYLNKELWYSEWNGSAWTTPTKIVSTMSKYIETRIDPTENLSYAYHPGSVFDPNDPDIVYTSKEISGVLELHRVDILGPTSFTVTQLTGGSYYDQHRFKMTTAPTYNLFWLNKQMYNHWLNSYHQQLIVATV